MGFLFLLKQLKGIKFWSDVFSCTNCQKGGFFVRIIYMSLDEKIKQLIQDRVAKMRAHRGRKYFEQNPSYPQQQQGKDLQDIQEKLKGLESIHFQIEEKVRKLKSLIPEISEQTTLCAVYLIYGKVLQTWEAIFLLARRGYNFEIMELTRSINENLDLIHTFHLDKEQTHLKKWFEGEIITNRVARRLSDEFIKKGSIKSVEEHGLSPYSMATDVYRGFSKYTHCSYAALLDSVDVFNEDFDWNRYGGAHYTLRNMEALKNAMVTTLIALKMTYMELKDPESYKEVDNILVEFAGPMDEQSLKDLIPRVKE